MIIIMTTPYSIVQEFNWKKTSMKRHGVRSGVLIKVYRFFNISTLGLLIFSLLDVYCIASNVTEISVNNIDIQHQFLTRSTWLLGFEGCRDEYNLTMASLDDINKVSIQLAEGGHGIDSRFNWLQKNLPIWTYAFEVTDKASGNSLQIKQSDVTRENAYRCSNGSEYEMGCCKNIQDTEKHCRSESGSESGSVDFPLFGLSTISEFAQPFWFNTSRWIKLPDERDILKGSDNLTVRCFVLHKDGVLRTDSCEAEHRTLCIEGTTRPVVLFTGTVRAPQDNPTNRHPSGRSSNFNKPSKDTNNTLSTVSNNSYPVKDQPDIWMDPHIRYSIIAVGIFILLAILIAVCCCCFRRRRSHGSEKRKSTGLADTYSETADSIAMKEGTIYETPDTSEYAIPSDAVKKARQRQSIGENEYDVINKSSKSPPNPSANAYHHVTLGSTLDKRRISDQEDHTYDVTNFGKNSVVLVPNDLTGNVYGDIEIKTER